MAINNWISLKYQEDLIKEAIEEGIKNQGYDLKYIDKLLYNWNNQGLRNKMKEGRFMEKEQKNMKCISKALYIISKLIKKVNQEKKKQITYTM